MHIVLQDWDHMSRCWLLDPATGALTQAPETERHGYVYFAGPAVRTALLPAAIYVRDGRIWLQYGDRRWDASDVVISHERSETGWNRFMVRAGTTQELELAYAGPRLDPLNQADPSFDSLDEELQDFFLWISNQLRDEGWRRAVLRDWSAGFGRP